MNPPRTSSPSELGVAWVASALALAAACNVPDVSMIVSLPTDLQPQTSWIEIGAFSTGCPSSGELAGGLPPSGLASRVAYAADASPVGMGKLDTGHYGFAAVARRDDCGVIASGCTNVDVSKLRTIDISLDPASGDPDASVCASGLVCSNARCVPPSANDQNAGAGCSMVFIGAGPLPDAIVGGPFVTAPAIVPLPSGGFVIAYAEYVEGDGTDRLTMQPIDSGGAALTPDQQSIIGHCPGATKVDATALAMGTAGGLAIVSHPTCMGESGYELFPLDTNGKTTTQNPRINGGPTTALSTHALTPAAATNRYLLASNVGGTAVLLLTDGQNVQPQTTTPFGTPQDTAARVVRTPNVTTVEVDGPSVGDGGVSGSVARIYLSSAGSDPTALGGPVDQVPAAVTALTAFGGRAFLLTNGAGKGQDVAMRGYDLGAKTQPSVSGGFSALKSTAVLALDAAAAQGRIFCALEQQDSLSIAVIDGAASVSPQLLHRVDLATDIRIPKSAHDGPVAIAASATQVAVVWVAHKAALADGDTVGGYAVFACRP